MKKRIIAFLLAFSCILSFLPLTFSARETDGCAALSVESGSGFPGSDVSVRVMIENNPGFTGMEFSVSWDEDLTLVSANNGSVFAEPLYHYQAPSYYRIPTTFMWDTERVNDSDIKDGTVLELLFHVSETATDGDRPKIKLSYEYGNVYGKTGQLEELVLSDGEIEVISFLPGDVNGDIRINTMDITLIRQYISDGRKTDPMGYNVTLNELAADVNDDGRINTMDITLIRQYISDGRKTDPLGYNVTLKAGHKRCDHSMTHVPATAATCTDDGNIEYWHCEKCGKYFSEASAVNGIAEADTVIKAIGHNGIPFEAVPATSKTEGYTAGVWCDVCETWISGHELIEPLEAGEANVTYRLGYVKTQGLNGVTEIVEDSYLKSHSIENPNPSVYKVGTGIAELETPVAPGYDFLGWYEYPEVNAKRVYSIPSTAQGDIVLYAVWSKKTFNVNLRDKINGDTTLSYTVDEGVSLGKDPEWSGYVFMGWSDDTGTVVESVPAGTTGNINLTANWTSERNKTVPVSKLNAPLILHDDDNGQILFTYEIGEIRNVPLYTIKDFLNVVAGGVTLTESITSTQSITVETANKIAETVSKATTATSAWTLSKDWNDTTSESTEHTEDVGEDVMQSVTDYRERCESQGKTPTYIIGSGNNTTYTTVDSGGSSVSAKTENSQDSENTSVPLKAETEKKWTTSEKLGAWADSVGAAAKTAAVVGAGITLASVGAATPVSVPVTAVVAAGLELVSGGLKVAQTIVGNNEKKKASEQEAQNEDANPSAEPASAYSAAPQSTTYYFNTNTGYNLSEKTGHSETVSQLQHKLVSDTHHYGESHSEGGSQSDSESHAMSEAKEREYGSTVTYSNAETTTVTRTYSNAGAKDGYYRIVCAGTAHVFAVVGYDIATSNFYVYTYAIMDDETKEFLDYSKDGSFTDYENGVLPFEVPRFVLDYVDIMTQRSAGLVIDDTTGMVMAYEPSEEAKNDILVSIPSYTSVTDAKGTQKAVKITGIADGLFKDNDAIQVVLLGCFCDEIPDSAFENCKNLKYVAAANYTSIGKNAFTGCTALEPLTIADTVTFIDDGAFAGVDFVSVKASNWDVVDAVLNCGAKNVKLTLPIAEDVSDSGTVRVLEIPSSFESFDVIGMENCEYRDLQIISNAEKSGFYDLTIRNSGRIPIVSDSENVLLNNVELENTGVCLNLDAQATELSIFGTNKLVSGNSRAAVVRSTNMDWYDPTVVGKLSMVGNLYVWGDLTGTRALSDYLEFKPGELLSVNKVQYYALLHAVMITFDPTDGTCAEVSREVDNGAVLGALPVPTRPYYTFTGWYTAKDGGTLVTADMLASADQTLYAHWEQNPATGWVLASELPEGADVVDRKWTYDQSTSYTEAQLAASGIIPVVDDVSWGEYGDWSAWSKTAVTESEFRDVDTNDVAAVKKKQYQYSRYVNSDSSWSAYQKGTFSGYYCGTYQETPWLDKALSVKETNVDGRNINRYGSYTGSFGSYLQNHWYNEKTREVEVTAAYTEYRYRERVMILTEHLESATAIQGSDTISNVQQWVRYIPREV